MAVFTSASNTGTTEDTIIRSIVQEQLLSKAVVRPTVMDLSSQATKGVKAVSLPRFSAAFSGPAAQNVDGATGVTMQTATFAVDTLNLDQWKNLPYRIPDRISMQSQVNLEAELAASAGKAMAIDLDSTIITEMATATINIQFDNDTNTTISVANINKAKVSLKRTT